MKYIISFFLVTILLVSSGCGVKKNQTDETGSAQFENNIDASAQNNTLPVQKTFNSEKIGVTFTYGEDVVGTPNEKIKIAEVDNKIYIYSGEDAYMKNGQSIEVFQKDPKLTFQQALKNKFLQGYSEKDCSVEVLKSGDYPVSGFKDSLNPNFVFAVISFPVDTARSDAESWQKNQDKCPADYTKTNAENFFVMDKNIPNKYFFVKLGQEMIATDGNLPSSSGVKNWFSSVRIK